jgi:hypothetical protein
MFIGANGLSNINEIPKAPSDDELRKEGMIINPSTKQQEEILTSPDFFSYTGPKYNQQEDELLDATEFSNTK